MPEIKQHSLKEFHLRAKLPQYFRYGAVVLLAVTIFIVIVGFYRGRNNTPFKVKGEHTQLSTDVTAEVNGYERLETDGGISKYYLKADHAKTFSDDHQELQNVYIRTYDDQGAEADSMSAAKALYIPEDNKTFTAYMNGDVNINTRDGLKVVTNNIIYTKKNETAEADLAVNFERDNIRGHSTGATVRMAAKQIDLLKDVEIETFESPEMVKSGVRYAKVNSGSASFDQGANKIELHDSVAININSKSAVGGDKVTDVKGGRAVLYLAGQGGDADVKNAQLDRFELFDDVHIATTENGSGPTNIDAGYALYNKKGDRFELRNAAHIVTNAGGQPTDIKADNATYDQPALKLDLNGSAEVTQGNDYIKGDNVAVDLFADKKLKYAVVRGNGLVRQSGEDRTTAVTAPEINASWGDSRQMAAANTVGVSLARLEPKAGSEYSLVTMSAPNAMHLTFKGAGLLSTLKTDGRTTISLNAAGGNADAANKRITADSVNTLFNDNGKDIRRAEAIGNAELYVEPLKASAENYKTTVNAPRFDCDFFATGNSAKLCVGGKKTKTVRVPTVAVEGRGEQTLLADTLNIAFSEQTKDVGRMDAVGGAKFTELQRVAIASQMSFTPSDSVVRLRGGEPTAWDADSRAKAKEIDWDTKNRHSYLRGGVSTTYYSRGSMGDSAPFESSNKPVFITSADADLDHNTQVATYTGNARGWQDNNYVRGDRITIRQSEGKMYAEGSVQSVLYDSKQKVGNKETNVPVYAASRALAYDRNSRVLQYNGDADIRQGTDRVTASRADVYLSETNEVAKTVAETSVVITQPGRRATGNWAQYTAANDTAILRGSPATVADAENGTSQGAELTFLMREHRVVAEGKSKPNTSGRIRSVYKLKTTP